MQRIAVPYISSSSWKKAWEEAQFIVFSERVRLNAAEGCYILFDCPGQVELFTLHGSLKSVVCAITDKWHYRCPACKACLAAMPLFVCWCAMPCSPAHPHACARVQLLRNLLGCSACSE